MDMELKPANGQQKEQIYTLYLAAFPEAERKPFSRIEETCAKGAGEMLALTEGDTFLGLATTVFWEDLVLLDYFAVEPDCRGTGIGSQALALLRQRYAGRRFFLEIETPRLPSDNHAQRERRKGFYLRNGLKETGITVMLVGVEMELLTDGSDLTYPEYRALYQNVFGDWLTKRIWELKL
jgi:GNAT superfamily N-acetyltransferase